MGRKFLCKVLSSWSQRLFSLLVAKCEGKAFGIVQLCPKGNGLEAWRRQKDKYEGRSANRLAAMLRGILNPRERWKKDSDVNKEFLESLNDWEILIGEYRAASGENVSDPFLVATILEHAPTRYQDILRAILAQQKENYPALRRWIKDYCVSSRNYGESGIAGGPVPMDVGQIKGDKSGKGKKGKGKGGKSNGKHVKGKVKSEKGSGNEKSSGNAQAPAQFQGYCGFCEKCGHKRADCRKRQREQGPSSTSSVKSATAFPSSNSADDAVVKVAAVTYSGEQPKEKDDRWCFAMTTDSTCQAVQGSVLIDS